MPSAHRWLAPALLGLALSACTTPVPLETLPSEVTARLCELTFECCGAELRRGYADLRDCEDQLDAAGLLRSVSVEGRADAIARGTLVYDANAARACLEQLTCTVFGDAPDVCLDVYVEQLRAGDGCTESVECAPTARIYDAGSCRGGICQPPLPLIGEACSAEGFCEANASCEGGACVGLANLGQVCTQDGDTCVNGLFCHRGTGVCTERLPLGAACSDPDDQCLGGLCVDDRCISWLCG